MNTALSPRIPASCVFNTAKLNGRGIVLLAARHNKRALQIELGADGHIDPTRSHLNYSLAGPDTPEEIAALAKSLMHTAGIDKPRKDFVAAIELLFSLPVAHGINQHMFFKDCLEWASSFFDCHVLSFDVHLDESTPHAHALILPLVNGRMNGSDLVGGKARLGEIRASFYADVAAKYGLKKPIPRLTGQAKSKMESAVLKHLKADPVMRSVVWPIVRDMIKNDPSIFANLLGITAPTKQSTKSAVEIMTSTGKGSTRIGFESMQQGEPYLV